MKTYAVVIRATVTKTILVDFKVKYFCPNHSADLGNIVAYSSDNGYGVAQGW